MNLNSTTHYIVTGCIDFGECKALINCGEDKAYADELVAELNMLTRRREIPRPKLDVFEVFGAWKKKHGFEHLKENMLTDKYEVQEALVVQRNS